MKKYFSIIPLFMVIFTQFCLADDMFEHKSQKMINKITSYQRINGELIDFVNVKNELYKLSEQKPKDKMKVNYIYHRLDNTAYKSEDLQHWQKLNSDEIIHQTTTPIKKPQLIIYPKLVDNSFEFDANEDTKFTVYSAYGFQVYEGTIKDGMIDLSKLTAGLYLIQINNNIIKINKI